MHIVIIWLCIHKYMFFYYSKCKFQVVEFIIMSSYFEVTLNSNSVFPIITRYTTITSIVIHVVLNAIVINICDLICKKEPLLSQHLRPNLKHCKNI